MIVKVAYTSVKHVISKFASWWFSSINRTMQPIVFQVTWLYISPYIFTTRHGDVKLGYGILIVIHLIHIPCKDFTVNVPQSILNPPDAPRFRPGLGTLYGAFARWLRGYILARKKIWHVYLIYLVVHSVNKMHRKQIFNYGNFVHFILFLRVFLILVYKPSLSVLYAVRCHAWWE